MAQPRAAKRRSRRAPKDRKDPQETAKFAGWRSRFAKCAFRDGQQRRRRASCKERLSRGPGNGHLWRARFVKYRLGMKDLLFVAITVGFFALAWIYVRAAERL
jgi:hypothetical protein